MTSPRYHHPLRVLFVCIANVCRSPIAEALFTHLLLEAGLSEAVTVDSAGSGLWQIGSNPHPGAISVLAAHGIEYDHIARLLRPEDLGEFDYILAMDNQVLRAIWTIGNGPAKIQPFVKYARRLKLEEVPDPSKTGDFDATYDVIRTGCEGFLAFLRRTHRL
jgi:protein-tyrosine phosphatase